MSKKYRPMFAKKKSHKLRNTIIFFLVCVILALGYFAYAEVFAGARDDDTAVSVYFPTEATEDDIVKILVENQVIKYPAAYKFCSLFGGKSYITGSHILTRDMSYPEIFSAIKTKNSGSVIAIVVNDGATISDIALVVADEFEVSKNDFLKAVTESEFAVETTRTDKKLEGYLAPGLYNFTKDTDMAAVVNAMTNRFTEQFDEAKKNRASQLGLSVDKVLTIASLVEKRGGTPEEMNANAQAIIHSLNSGVALNNEDALKYSLNKKELTETDKKIDTPYNTFIRAGLPKGPICSPSTAAIEAVLG